MTIHLSELRDFPATDQAIRAVSSPARTRLAGQLPAVTSTDQSIRAGGKQ